MIPLCRVTLLRLTALKNTCPDFLTRMATSVARRRKRVSLLYFTNSNTEVLIYKFHFFSVNNVVRVIRTCGYINETMDQVPEGAVLPKTCEKQSGAVVIETCVCNSGDGCNSVGSLTGGPLTYLLPLAVGALTLALRAR